MAYQALYRKWRPRVFDDVVGLPTVTGTLANEVACGRIAHAYLFTGSRGTGKTTCARILAKAINCENPQNGDPCGECASCKSIDAGTSMDITEIDAASNNGIDDIRELRENTNFTPAELKYRVYIIDEVHMLSNQAFNALLKTLEEPPEFVVFILATTEVYQLPTTILSRCQRFDFRRIASEDIRDRIMYIASKEGVELELNAAEMIARIADGGLRDAISLLDQCIAYAANIDEELVEKVAGLTSKDYLTDITREIISGKSSNAVDIIDRLYSESCDMEQLCRELTAHFRDLMLLKVSDNSSKHIKTDKKTVDELKTLAAQMTLNRIIAILERLQDTQRIMKYSSDRLVDMEICMVRLCEPKLDESVAALNARIAELEAKIASGNITVQSTPVMEVKPKKEEKAVQKEQKPIKRADGLDSNAVTEPVLEWSEIMATLRKVSPGSVPFLQNVRARKRGDSIILSEVPDFAADQLTGKNGNGELKAMLEKSAAQVLGKHYAVLLSTENADGTVEKSSNPLDDILKRATLAGIDIEDED